jgi:rhamnose utilization protein RhaD (predicted bifunctional aldolase and dehydrogenase)
VIAIAASVNQEKLTKEIYGDDVIYIPWQRPGFDIGLKIEQLIKENPTAKGILLGHHGMSSWNNDDKTCYETALEIIDRAASFIEAHDKGEETFGGQKHQPLSEADRQRLQTQIIPFIRGQVSAHKRFVGTVQDDERMLRFVNSNDGPRLAELGTSCPDHFLRTKIKPLFVDWNPASGRCRKTEERDRDRLG